MSTKDISFKISELVKRGFLIDSKYIPNIEAKVYTLPEKYFSPTFKK